MPDAKTVWLHRERLSQAGLIETLFEDFDDYLKDQGCQAMCCQIIDASIVAVPVQRNGRGEGETPDVWDNRPAKRRQKDADARWTKKHGKSYYGYKNHINIDRSPEADPALPGDGGGGARRPTETPSLKAAVALVGRQHHRQTAVHSLPP